jgi:uncharacterized YccA/Bax inhibitor family protein
MRASNPTLNDSVFERAIVDARTESQPGWAAPAGAPPRGPGSRPAGDGPVSPWRGYQSMTIGGVATAVGVLFVLLLVGGAIGWSATTPPTEVTAGDAPAWLFGALIGGFVLALVITFKPTWARFLAPVYAILEGLFLGGISRLFEGAYPGIVLQAVGLTVAVFGLMWFAFATRLIRVTDKLRTGIFVATGAVALVYLVGLVARLFGGEVGFINEPTTFGIVFSLVVVGIAAFNLLLDFDLVERGVEQGAPKYMEWYAAFGLLVTLVWLYLELLRLLSKLRER